MWITVVMTATEWVNFFRLRCHPDAEIHFQQIAGMIRDSLAAGSPRSVKAGDWHLPFIQDDELSLSIETLKKCSVARNARVSYMTHEGKRDIEKDLELFERLVQGSGFGHWSPHEHVAQALEKAERSGPFVGWKQYRKEFAQECASA
jgi:thymidylate synthase ThyX